LYRTRNHYQNLVSGTKREKLDGMLEKLLEHDRGLISEIGQINKRLNILDKEKEFYFSRVGLVRFNPFERSGGDQSFVIALLDYQKNGLVLNFIYTRDGLRVYGKKVKNGKGSEYELSEEEKKAIEKSN
jgi:hypothetical protein